MKRILITRTDRIGDVLLSTPVFKAVRTAYPDSYIAVMVRPYTKDCVEGNPYINEVIIYDKYGRHKSLWSSLKFAAGLRKRRFDLALVLHPTNRANIITFLAGIPERVGYDKKLGFFLTKRIAHKKQHGQKHELDYTLDIIKAIGIDAGERHPYMNVRRDARDKMNRRLSARGIKAGDKLVAIHPSSSCPSKRWMPESFAKVADTLTERDKVKIVIVSGREGTVHASAMKGAMDHEPVDLSGATTISELGALLKRCGLFISNDSGPVHVASAVGTPVVAIFGRRDKGLGPKRWGPTGKHDIILHKDVGCRRCPAHNCGKGFLCLKAISEEEVIKAAETILKRGGGKP